MGTLTIEPFDATLGAMVHHVSLPDLGPREWAEIEAAFHTYAVLVFPNQHLSSEQQRDFAQRFGPLEEGLMGTRPTVPISNQTSDGTIRPLDDPILHVLRGNEHWHTDSTYMPVSACASVLSARTVPSWGGQTEWADMRAGYQVLSSESKHQIADLAAHHSLQYSQAKAGLPPHEGYGMSESARPLRPLVKVHPVTGAPSLFIGRHAHEVVGLTANESESLLDELLDTACQPPRLHKHQWTPGDVVVWDNRCVLHRAHPYDYNEARVMMHTRVAGNPKTEAGLTR